MKRITPAGAGKTRPPHHRRRAREDHPRRCGENMIPPCRLCVNAGSPPQVRGKHTLSRVGRLLARITPAGAGKTPIFTCGNNGGKDHPRRCGENRAIPMKQRSRLGSPPQVRGKLNFSCSLLGVTRITPAGAGKTKACSLSTNIARDHPRRCGENSISHARSSA